MMNMRVSIQYLRQWGNDAASMDVKHNVYLGIFSHTLTAVECLLAINVLRVQTSQGGYGEEGWWLGWCKRSCTVQLPPTILVRQHLHAFIFWCLITLCPVCPPLRCCWFQHHQPGPRSWRVASFNPLIPGFSSDQDQTTHCSEQPAWCPDFRQVISEIESSKVVFVKFCSS